MKNIPKSIDLLKKKNTNNMLAVCFQVTVLNIFPLINFITPISNTYKNINSYIFSPYQGDMRRSRQRVMVE